MSDTTARFLADFESFYTAVDQSVHKIRDFEENAHKVETSLNRMVDSFSGTKVIQDATLMAEAVERVGGTSKLTESELARVAAKAEEAAAKMRALGMEVPASITTLTKSVGDVSGGLQRVTTTADSATGGFRQFTTTTGTANNALTSFHTGLAQADKTLGALGVNIGPQLQAVRELGQAAGMTAGQIGLIGTAGLVVGAGIAGWQIGRAIAEYTGLDQTISHSVSVLMGWGDTATQTAGVVSDQLTRASATAGREITTLNEAMKINTEEAKRLADAHTKAAEAWTAAQKRMKAESDAMVAASIKLEDSLLGRDVVARAEDLQTALEVLATQGLTPIKSQWAGIVTEMENAMKAMEAAGKKGSWLYQQFQGYARQFGYKTPEGLLQSRNLPVAGLMTAPTATIDDATRLSVEGAHAAVDAAKDATDWWQRYEKDQAEIVAASEARIEEMATKAPKVHGEMAGAMIGQIEAYGRAAESAIKIAVPKEFDWAGAYKEAGMFVAGSYLSGMAGRGQTTPSFGTTVNVGNFIGTDRSAAQQLARLVGDEILRASNRRFDGS